MRKSITSAILVLSAVSIVLLTVNVALALHPDTHEKLNENITLNQYPACYPLDGYLKQNLNLKDGVQEIVNGDKIWRWVRLGGSKEDTEIVPILRAFNHFHDPLESNWFWAGFGHTGAFKSSAVWFMEPYQEIVFGSYSWPDARRYYYEALTAPYETTRDSYYALCFRSLGQCMHLVQDASVPAHVRNDGHVQYHYEHWVNDNMAEVDAYLKNSVSPVTPHLVNAPITDLIDADIYNGTNPDITLTGAVGIAEYTNANFFSEDTVFKNYPYPSRLSSAIPVDNYITDPTDTSKQVLRKYFFKTGDGDNGYPLAAMNYAEHYRRTYLPWLDISYIYDGGQAGVLDKLCYVEYARRLLPRAVAYSSETLRYFFRGDIDAVGAKTEKDSDGNIAGLVLKVKNSTSGESMAGGAFTVSYRFKGKSDTYYTCGKSKSDLTLAASLASGQTGESEYSFDLSTPIPADATDKQYTLVYRGQLGAEPGAVAAKVFKPKSGAIDDWEEGQKWVTSNTATALSLEQAPELVYENTASLKVSLANAYAEKYFGQSYYNSATDISPTSEIKALGQTGLTFSAPTVITRVAFYVLPGWNTANLNEDTVVRIYGNTGAYPGKLLAESKHVTITPQNMGLLWYEFEPAVKMPTASYSSFNITFEPVGGSGAPLVVYLYTSGGYYFQGKQLRLLSTGWTTDNNCDMSILWATEAPPLASLNKAVDLSGKENLSIAVRSTTLTGTVANLQYGTDKDHVKTIPLAVNQTASYQVIKTPITNISDAGDEMDLSAIGYFAITLGKDGRAADGKCKENTIYVDLIEAY